MEELKLTKEKNNNESIKNIIPCKTKSKECKSTQEIKKHNDLSNADIIKTKLIMRDSITIDVKGKPTTTAIPIPLSLLIVEINYHFNLEGQDKISDEADLNKWFESKEDKDLMYYYEKFLIAWQILTNDIKTFSPVGSKIKFTIKSELKFNKDIPQELMQAMECEKIDYE